jgi:hypothetical protein
MTLNEKNSMMPFLTFYFLKFSTIRFAGYFSEIMECIPFALNAARTQVIKRLQID